MQKNSFLSYERMVIGAGILNIFLLILFFILNLSENILDYKTFENIYSEIDAVVTIIIALSAFSSVVMLLVTLIRVGYFAVTKKIKPPGWNPGQKLVFSIGNLIFTCVLIWGWSYLYMLIPGNNPISLDKPIIYLYPPQQQEVTVRLDFSGELKTTYPKIINNTWNVTAYPDGTLLNHTDNRVYQSLFWEGEKHMNFDFSQGFIVKGSDTEAFLQQKLAEIGLTSKEANEFILYWLPEMEGNPYNAVHFSTTEYQSVAKLEITPPPDSVLRVFMAYKPIAKPFVTTPQKLEPFTRKGFAVVEWGGTKVE